MGKGGGSAKQDVNRYRMSVHFGIAAELDAITGIYIGEKEAWSGDVTTETAIGINRQDLFGGDKKEGGVLGIAYYLPGGPTQVFPNGLAARRGLTSSTHPAYRGLASCYFVGAVDGVSPGLGWGAGGGYRGFYWGATPYLQSVWIRGRRAPKGLNPDYALIGNQLTVSINNYAVTINGTTVTVLDGHPTTVAGHSVTISQTSVDGDRTFEIDGLTVLIQPYTIDSDGDHGSGTTVTVESSVGEMVGGTVTLAGVTVSGSTVSPTISMGASGQDANPAHIIYECLTNTTWGMGATDAIVDRDIFEAVAQVLFHEGFGLSLIWTKEDTIEAFVSEILDHIQAALFVDPETGKLTLKLFRDDYGSITTLPLITPDNAVLDNFQRKLWGETVNEISVTWTNPINEQEETVSWQDLGNIVTQAGVVSDSRNFYGVRRSDLALKLAAREVRQSSAPLASCDALLDRSFWNLKPGSVVRLTWPEYEIENLVVRVMNLDYGKVGEPDITVSLLEDIFSLDHATNDGSAASGFVDGSAAPTPMDHVKVITVPAYFTSRYLSAADANAIQYPEVLSAILGASSNRDAAYYELMGQVTQANGVTGAEERGTKGLLGYAQLQSDLAEEATSTISNFGEITNGIGPNPAGFMFIGDATERTMEIALLESVDADGNWTVRRGILDTVPRKWAAGTSVWFYDVRNDFVDRQHHSDAEAVTYKLLTVTSQGKLSPSLSPVYGETLTGRPHLPNRPANVKINGVAFGPVNLVGSGVNPIPITWSNRNRTLEDSTVLKWTDATVTPEAGQTTTIKLCKTSDGSTITTITGLTGTSYNLPTSAFAGEFQADVYISSVRDGLSSLMSVARRVRISDDPSHPGSAIGDPGEPADTPYTPPSDYPEPIEPPVPCVVVETAFLTANESRDGPGRTIPAGEVIPYQTWAWTRPELPGGTLGEWGAYLVTGLEVVEAKVMAAKAHPCATPLHRFWHDGWVRMHTIGEPSGNRLVARITVDGAHTYATVEDDGTVIVSHNTKQYI